MKNKFPTMSPAQVSGIMILTAGAATLFYKPLLAAALTGGYVAVCVAASFCPRLSFYLPVIHRGNTGKNFVALTFDDGPSPLTLHILDLLDQYAAKATFFVSGRNTLKYPNIIHEIIRRGHTIGNHSFHHNPFLMLGSYHYLYQEILQTQEVLKNMGIETHVFRPPVGIINPKLPSVLNRLGMFCVTFSCRALDAGNRRLKNLAARILKKVRGDDIILLHDVIPPDSENASQLLFEMEKILQELDARGLQVVSLDDLIGRKVMIKNM
jgi:peptidoglycan/xylan/chitin deacetylase (PgdA/CDA1 family)